MSLIPVEEALRRVLAGIARPVEAETVPLAACAGRTLAEDVARPARPAALRGLRHGRLCGARRRHRRRSRQPCRSSAPAPPGIASTGRSARARPCGSSPARPCPTAPIPSSSRRTREPRRRSGDGHGACAAAPAHPASRARFQGGRGRFCAGRQPPRQPAHRACGRHGPRHASGPPQAPRRDPGDRRRAGAGREKPRVPTRSSRRACRRPP